MKLVSEKGIKENAEGKRSVERKIKESVEKTLFGAKMEKMWLAPNNDLFILVSMPKSLNYYVQEAVKEYKSRPLNN